MRLALLESDRWRVIVEPTNILDIDTLVGPARNHVGHVLDRYNDEQMATLFDYFAHAALAFHQAAAEIRRSRDGSRTRDTAPPSKPS